MVGRTEGGGGSIGQKQNKGVKQVRGLGSGRVGQVSWQGYSIVQGQSSAWGTVGLGRKAGLGGRGQSRTDGCSMTGVQERREGSGQDKNVNET